MEDQKRLRVGENEELYQIVALRCIHKRRGAASAECHPYVVGNSGSCSRVCSRNVRVASMAILDRRVGVSSRSVSKPYECCVADPIVVIFSRLSRITSKIFHIHCKK